MIKKVAVQVLTVDGVKTIVVGEGPVNLLKVWYKGQPCRILKVQEVSVTSARR